LEGGLFSGEGFKKEILKTQIIMAQESNLNNDMKV
jgi:hypothetical protein